MNPTDPTGRSFLSYRRSRLLEAQLVLGALHDRGVPTWQDMKDLESAPTNDALQAVIDDPLTANGILWLTPEVAQSEVIRQIEQVGLIRRATRGDDFFLLPVCAGKLSYQAAATVGDAGLTLERLSNWNMMAVSGDPINQGEAAAVADRVLDHRLRAIDRVLPPSATLPLRLFTRALAPFQPGVALSLDWSPRFSGRLAADGAWTTHFLPALASVARALRLYGGGRTIEASGPAALPAATALGSTFLAQSGLPIQWRQATVGQPEQIWSLSVTREPTGFVATPRSHDTSSRDIAVMVCVNEDVERAVVRSPACPQKWRGVVKIAHPAQNRFVITSPGQATDIAMLVAEGLRQARDRFGLFDGVHLFMAAPVGLAMLTGQMLNTFNGIQLYEHLPDTSHGTYAPVVRLDPSGAD